MNAPDGHQKLELDLGGYLPGERLAIAILDFSARFRENMDTDLRRRLDTHLVKALDRIDQALDAIAKTAGG